MKKALQSTLRDEDIQAEVLIKPVADRTKGFSELQTFNPQQAIARAKGSVWELLCFGPHDVELLSTAVRRLEPLGLRLLHAAHSHARVAGEAKAHHECSRIYVETVQVKSDKSEVQSEEEVSAFRASVLKVLMGTYNSEDATNFSVCSVDEASLEKLHEKLQQELQEVRPAPAPAPAPAPQPRPQPQPDT